MLRNKLFLKPWIAEWKAHQEPVRSLPGACREFAKSLPGACQEPTGSLARVRRQPKGNRKLAPVLLRSLASGCFTSGNGYGSVSRFESANISIAMLAQASFAQSKLILLS